MRELVYLSRRKLAQFQPARPRGRFLRRVTGFGAKAPLSMGEVSMTFAEETAKSWGPDLQMVIDELDKRVRGVQWYESDDLQVGDWVQFESRMNFAVLDVRALPDDNPLLFWEPRGLDKDGRADAVLLLHGSPDGLVGGPPNLGPSDRTLQKSGSAAGMIIGTFRRLRQSDEPLMDDAYWPVLLGGLVDMLDQEYPAFTASWLAGYARITGLIDSYRGSPDRAGPPRRGRRARPGRGPRFILATPLYVERVPPPEEV